MLVLAASALVLAGAQGSCVGVVLALAGVAASLGRLVYAGAAVPAGVEEPFDNFGSVGVVLALVELEGALGHCVGMGGDAAGLAAVLEGSGLWLESAVSWLQVLDRHCSCQYEYTTRGKKRVLTC